MYWPDDGRGELSAPCIRLLYSGPCNAVSGEADSPPGWQSAPVRESHHQCRQPEAETGNVADGSPSMNCGGFKPRYTLHQLQLKKVTTLYVTNLISEILVQEQEALGKKEKHESYLLLQWRLWLMVKTRFFLGCGNGWQPSHCQVNSSLKGNTVQSKFSVHYPGILASLDFSVIDSFYLVDKTFWSDQFHIGLFEVDSLVVEWFEIVLFILLPPNLQHINIVDFRRRVDPDLIPSIMRYAQQPCRVVLKTPKPGQRGTTVHLIELPLSLPPLVILGLKTTKDKRYSHYWILLQTLNDITWLVTVYPVNSFSVDYLRRAYNQNLSHSPPIYSYFQYVCRMEIKPQTSFFNLSHVFLYSNLTQILWQAVQPNFS